MIDFQTCFKCKHCTYNKPVKTKDGLKNLILPSISCDLEGDILVMNDNPPSKCPSKLEHIVIAQYIPKEFSEKMSN